jgi:predicted transcriptional regulator
MYITTQRGEELSETIVKPRVNDGELLRLLICSDLRKKLLLALKNGTTSLAGLRQATGASSTAAIHALRELEKERLTFQDGKRNYLLTSSGKIVALHVESFVQTVNVITQFGKFWLEHDLSGIPEDSLKNIGYLQESQVLTSMPTDVFNAFSTFITLLEDAKVIRGVAPVFAPDLLDVYAELAAKGIPIELVVTREVLENMLELADRSALKDQLKENLRLFVIKQNPKTAFTVTDYFFMVGLFRLDGSYDYSDELLSYSNDALRWGRELFDHYLRASKEFDLRL